MLSVQRSRESDQPAHKRRKLNNHYSAGLGNSDDAKDPVEQKLLRSQAEFRDQRFTLQVPFVTIASLLAAEDVMLSADAHSCVIKVADNTTNDTCR